MIISVIICTYNRAASLRCTLESCCALSVPDDASWELLVVDNNSTDATQEVCAAFASRLPLRTIMEPRQGKSHALNRGIREANGALLLFTDDDVDLAPNWLSAYHAAASRHSGATFFGGRVLPRWDVPPPRWVVENQDWLLINVHVDRGDAEMGITELMDADEPPFFVGANLAIRSTVFLADKLFFKEALGPSGGDLDAVINGRGEEIELEERLLAGGHGGVYVPDAVVYHRHAAHRQTERYVRKYYFGAGLTTARLLSAPPRGQFWFGAPRSSWRSLLVSASKYIATRPWGHSRAWLKAEAKMACAAGYIAEWRRLQRQKRGGAS
jgi:glucosyl-dolichyl phosphate glucuronosyltransferase